MDICKKTALWRKIFYYMKCPRALSAEKNLIQQLAKHHPLKGLRVNPAKLHWLPYLSDVKRDKFSIHKKKHMSEDV